MDPKICTKKEEVTSMLVEHGKATKHSMTLTRSPLRLQFEEEEEEEEMFQSKKGEMVKIKKQERKRERESREGRRAAEKNLKLCIGPFLKYAVGPGQAPRCSKPRERSLLQHTPAAKQSMQAMSTPDAASKVEAAATAKNGER
ncbi:unnamed protein product [Ilex paraguariensis]|uniref:Uncharacterized protein n=1 Tax=Ilex paraguariensis TaxID=185542 RepID=A0ABC8RS21_9AQUA